MPIILVFCGYIDSNINTQRKHNAMYNPNQPKLHVYCVFICLPYGGYSRTSDHCCQIDDDMHRNGCNLPRVVTREQVINAARLTTICTGTVVT